MNVGLMTCYVNNYGACLQAYALQQAIKKDGNECEIIKYTPYADIADAVNLQHIPEPMMLRITRMIKHPFQFYLRKLDRKNQAKRDLKFEEFRQERLIFADKLYTSWDELRETPPPYDSFVCGSDQIWNPVIHHNLNVGPYFLDFVPENKGKIAYAPSIGVQHVPQECHSDMKRLINRLDAVSVREQRGAELISEIAGQEAPVVLDPTLLFDGEWWSKVVKPVEVKKPYILCYLFNENESTYEFVEKMRKETGYEVVTLPFALKDIYKKNSTKIYDAGPSEFLYLIKNASLIITDSFHATAFSINFNRNFICLFRNTDNEKNNMNSRITSILSLAGLEDRLITKPEEVNEPLGDIDYTEVNKRISARREKDRAFLWNSIKNGAKND